VRLLAALTLARHTEKENALERKSGKVTANSNAKDASFQLVRLTDQINALKKQLQNEQFNNEENVVNLQKSQLVRNFFFPPNG
jgi:hypothetical protein